MLAVLLALLWRYILVEPDEGVGHTLSRSSFGVIIMLDSLHLSLSDEEFDDLGNYLETIPGAMNIEKVHGFLTALQCSPQLVMPSNFFPYIFGEDHVYDSSEELTKYTGLLLRLWNEISNQLNNNAEFDPIFIEQENGKSPGNEWAEGFLFGMHLDQEGWKVLVDDDDHMGILIPIFALGHEYDPDPELRPDPITDEKRELMLAGIKAYTPKIFEYLKKYRSQSIGLNRSKQIPFRRTSGKIGRNEPCPCGSGLKYKHCCGKN